MSHKLSITLDPRKSLTIYDDEEAGLLAVRHGAQDYLVKGREDGVGLRRAIRHSVERMQAKEVLRLGERRLRRIVEQNADGILIVNRDGIVTLDETGALESVNPAVVALFGYPAEDLIGRGLALLVPDEPAIRHDGWLRECADSGERRLVGRGPIEVNGRRKDGSLFALDVKIDEMRLTQRRFVAVLRDVSERRRVEKHLRLYTEAVVRSNAELEQLASVASHDLQEPLRKIRAFGGRLESRYQDVLGEQGRDYLERMIDASRRMQGLIDDLLSYARVTTRAELPKRVDIGAVACLASTDLQLRLEETGGRVEVGEMPIIEADPRAMQQLFQNLIGNALKFRRPQASPVVVISGRSVPGPEGRLARDGEIGIPWWEIAVSDNGIGFEDKYRERIFRMFQRLHGRFEYSGSGMGLAICRKIVEQHGGTIDAHGTPAEGATFRVLLPERQPPAVPAA